MATDYKYPVETMQPGLSRDEALSAMKAEGLTIAEAIKSAMLRYGLGLGAAKQLVASHPAWIATAVAAEPFQDELIESLRSVDQMPK